MSEQFSNGGSAVVGSGGIDSSATTLPTLYRSGLPSTGVFRVKIESEIIKVTTGGNSTASWTVERGSEGTTAAAHAEGVAIKQVLTAGALTDAIGAGGGSGMTNPMITSGDLIYGGASGSPTRLPVGDDAQVLTLASGVPTWAAATGSGSGGGAGGGGLTLVPPDEGDLAWFNQGSTAVDIDNSTEGKTILSTPSFGTMDQVRGRVKTVATGGWQFDVGGYLMPSPYAGHEVEAGVFVTDGTKAITWGVRNVAGVHKLCVGRWDNATTRTAGYTETFLPIQVLSPFFLRITDAGFDPVRYFYSLDGVWWVFCFSENKTAFLAASAIDSFGYYVNYVEDASTAKNGDSGVIVTHLNNS